MIPTSVLSQVIPLLKGLATHLIREGRWPKTVKAAAMRIEGVLPVVMDQGSLDEREKAQQHAVEIILYGLFIWHFWGLPAKELKKNARFKRRRNRLGD